MKIKITLAQQKFKFGEVDVNFKRAEGWIEEASENNSDLLLLPELWASGYDLENWRDYAVPLGEGLFSKLKVLAKKNQIAIGSSLLELKEGKVYNTFVLFGKTGETLGLYRKIHRFRLLAEEKWLEAGDELSMASTPWGSVGLAICYDLRFPEIFRPYAVAGAHLCLIVAEWPEKRITHWSKLLQARAIENQMYIVGVNKVGESQGVKLGGRSAVIDPWGVPVIEGDDGEDLLTTEIDLSVSLKARKQIPILSDRRTDVYKRIEEWSESLKHDV